MSPHGVQFEVLERTKGQEVVWSSTTGGGGARSAAYGCGLFNAQAFFT